MSCQYHRLCRLYIVVIIIFTIDITIIFIIVIIIVMNVLIIIGYIHKQLNQQYALESVFFNPASLSHNQLCATVGGSRSLGALRLG